MEQAQKTRGRRGNHTMSGH
uniref:Vpr n=1 Tax=Human immunodeficiency virus type 1 TaxID=11676 RepID=C7G2A9_HV1|nr:Vpr [Human immunodeficiency virus 1]